MKFVNRPLAVLTLCFFISFSVFMNTDFSHGVLCGAVCTALTVLSASLSFCINKRDIGKAVFLRYTALVLAGIAASSFYSFAVKERAEREISRFDAKTSVVSGTVTEKLYSGSYNGYTLSLERAFGGDEDAVVCLVTKTVLETGDTVRAEVTFEKIESTDTFDSKKYYLSKGISVCARAESAVKTGEKSSVGILAGKLNGKMSERLTKNMSDESGSVAAAVLLGDRSGMSGTVKRDLSRVGISHLIAISGMHVSFIFASFSFAMSKARIGKKKIALLAIALMVFYMFITGFTASVVRAAVICCISCVIVLAGLSFDGVTALGVCAAAMIVFNPYYAVDMGMQLSFSAYLGCLAAVSLLRRLGFAGKKREKLISRILVRIASSVLFSAVVVLFSLPVSLLCFDEISAISPLSNLIFIPLFSVIMYFSFFVLAVSPIPFLYTAVSFAADKFIGFVLLLVRAVAPIRHITVSLNYPFSPYIVILISACIVICVCASKKFAAVSGAVLAAGIAFYGVGAVMYEANFNEYVTVSRVGSEGNDMIVVASEGETLICDVSSGAASCIDLAVAKTKEFCRTEVDGYLMTHYSDRHLKAAERLVQQIRLEYVCLVTPSDTERDAYSAAARYFETEGIKIVNAGTLPENVKLGSLKLSFSKNRYKKNSSKPAVCFCIDSGKEKTVYLGSGWNDLHPNAEGVFGIDENTYVIMGDFGSPPASSVGTSDRISDDRIFSFVSADDDVSPYLASLNAVSRYEPNESCVIKMKK